VDNQSEENSAEFLSKQWNAREMVYPIVQTNRRKSTHRTQEIIEYGPPISGRRKYQRLPTNFASGVFLYPYTNLPTMFP
jgi:hypothetical protein